MIGRVYRWRGELWRVLARWLPPGECRPTFVCPTCGNVTLAGRGAVGQWGSCCIPSSEWRTGQYTHRRIAGGPRNVLIENVTTGVRVVRPSRGLRKVSGE